MEANTETQVANGFIHWMLSSGVTGELAREDLHIALAIAVTRIGKWISEQEDEEDSLVKEEISRVGRLASLSRALGCEITPESL